MTDISKDIFYRQFIGLEVEEAIECAKFIDNSIRIVEKDGNVMVITRDVNLSRINVKVKDGKISEVCSLG